MIELTCTKCRRVLRIDDGFAGGVCRCQHCKTLQTVPRTARHVQASGKLPVGSGLDDLADVIASSGLSNDPLGETQPVRQTSLLPWIVAFGATGLAGVIGLAWLLTASTSAPPNLPAGPSVAAAAEPTGLVETNAPPTMQATEGKSPRFLDLPLEGTLIVFVLDRGAATSDMFDTLKVAAQQSLQTLTAEQRFQLVFWDNGQGPLAIPAHPNFALPNRIEEAIRAMDKVYAFGASDGASAVAKAFAVEPVVVVLASGKGDDLDDAFARTVMGVRGTSKARVHSVSLGEGDSPGLARIAQETGGQYRHVTAAELRAQTR